MRPDYPGAFTTRYERQSPTSNVPDSDIARATRFRPTTYTALITLSTKYTATMLRFIQSMHTCFYWYHACKTKTYTLPIPIFLTPSNHVHPRENNDPLVLDSGRLQSPLTILPTTSDSHPPYSAANCTAPAPSSHYKSSKPNSSHSHQPAPPPAQTQSQTSAAPHKQPSSHTSPPSPA